jgi:hypothetical protein
MAARGILRVEDSVRKEHAEKNAGANKTGATGHGLNGAMENHDATPTATAAHQDMAKDASTTTSALQTATGNPKEKVIAKAERVTAKAAKMIARASKAPREERAITAVEDTAGARGGLPGGDACTARCVNGQADPGA